MSTPPAPDSPALHELQKLIDAHRALPGPLLPLLHAIQDRHAFIPDWAVAPVAQGLGLSRAEVHGVISYYPFLRSEAPGRHLVQICQGEACQACGARELLERAGAELACAPNATRRDGVLTLEEVFCLGACANGPALRVDGRLQLRFDETKLQSLRQAIGSAA